MQWAPGCVHFTENVCYCRCRRCSAGEPTIRVFIIISYPLSVGSHQNMLLTTSYLGIGFRVGLLLLELVPVLRQRLVVLYPVYANRLITSNFSVHMHHGKNNNLYCCILNLPRNAINFNMWMQILKASNNMFVCVCILFYSTSYMERYNYFL